MLDYNPTTQYDFSKTKIRTFQNFPFNQIDLETISKSLNCVSVSMKDSTHETGDYEKRRKSGSRAC